MPALDTRIKPGSMNAMANRESMLAAITTFRECEQRVRDNSNRQAERFEKRGQLLPRARLAALLDEGSDFIELSTLAGLGMHDDDGAENAAGGNNIIGIGMVSGVRCLVVINDSAIKGGAITPMGLRKTLRAQEIALKNKLPMINLIESAGANLLYQAEIFVDGGCIFRNMAHLSAAGIPQITVVHGSSTAGGAYMPGMSDYVVVVRGKAKIFLAGPPLLKAATGEIADDESLGGAEMHTSVSGVAEYLAEDDGSAIATAREILAKLPWNAALPTPPPAGAEPLYDADSLLDVVPANPKRAYDVREIIARLVDGSDFLDFKPRYGTNTVCGHGAIAGHACAFIGNNAPLFAQDAAKAAQFIQLCCQSGTPIVYLQNTTGYMVGTESETAGIVKHGAKMIQAVANATVPQVTVLVGASYGAGNYGMCGRAFDPRFIFAWPNSRIAVMGGEQAAKVMSIVTEEKLKRRGEEPDETALAAMRDEISTRIEGESQPLYATARLWDDGIIDPRDTRAVLATVLAVCREAEARVLRPNTFGVGRM
jgi:geranyl-CoA carboxylase beta subunit